MNEPILPQWMWDIVTDPWCFLYRAASRAVRRLWFWLRFRRSHFIRDDRGFDGWLWVEAKPRWWYRAF